MRSAENEQLILAMWDDYEREGRPDLAGLLEEAGLDRRLASQAYLGLHEAAA